MKFLILLTFGVVASLADQSQLLQEFSIGNHQFTSDVYKQLLKSSTGNILVCPLSAEIILALTHAGARGETAKQMSSGLRLPESSEKIREIFTALTQELRNDNKYTLTSANKVYVKHDFSINQQFKDVAVKAFDADIQNVDFSKSEQVVSEINKWVSDKTENYIKNLLSPADINSATRAVLVNALYFQGQWKKEFQTRKTAKKPFYLNTNNHVDVDMMTTVSRFNYYECSELDAKVLEMPYKGDDVSMTFVLPNEKEGLNRIETNIEKAFEAPKYNSTFVHAVIPKFKVDTTIKFIPILKALGIEDAFKSSADFSGLASGPLKIDQVIQKNHVEVDEKGTKAASATAVVIGLGAGLPPPIQATFIADHPFFYYIKKGNIVLFAGSIKKF